jgi:2,3-diketo-5-methylthio-1-phosphopentane phosphatase
MKKRYAVFIDFDNTITTRDVFDGIVAGFSADERWKVLEKDWKAGRIGSKECLERQLKGVRVTRRRLDSYLSKVRLDPYFRRLFRLLRSKRVKTIILSDNFDYILKAILFKKGFKDAKIFSNRVRLADSSLVPDFPLRDAQCLKCAHCKRNTMFANISEGETTVYIGDGLSDLCPSRYADIVFAKGSLAGYLRREKKPHIACGGLKKVYGYFKESL